MRSIALAILALCACAEHGRRTGDAGDDGGAMSCAASGVCPAGPACGAQCCKHGEQCVNGTCQCGMKPACGTGDVCEAPGPVGGDRCGTLCCGRSGPCPL